MKDNTNGSAAVELAFLMPLFLFFSVSLWNFFEKTTMRRVQLVKAEETFKENLRKRELAKPLLERPCEVHPAICLGRKK